MRHRVGGRKFGLPSDQRRALLKGLVRALLVNEKIVTTETRAKDVKPIAEKLITTARRGDLNARRLVRTYLDSNVSAFGVDEKGKLAANPNYAPAKLFDDIAKRYGSRPGGYTRITKLGARRGDGAPMVLLELVEGDNVPAPETPAAAAPVRQRRRGLFGKK